MALHLPHVSIIILTVSMFFTTLQHTAAANDDAQLLKAAGSGDLASVERVLAAGVNVDAKSPDGFTALIYAAAGGHYRVFHALLKGGATPDVVTRMNIQAYLYAGGPEQRRLSVGTTALIEASQKGEITIVTGLLDRGADPNLRNHFGQTALMFAAQANHLEVLNALILAGAQLDTRSELLGMGGWTVAPAMEKSIKSSLGRTALLVAAKQGHLSIVDRLLVRGASVDLQDNAGSSPLIEAVFGGRIQVVARLLAAGASVDVTTQTGASVLHAAAAAPIVIVKLLLKADAEVDARDKKGRTPLILASALGSVEVIDALISSGAQVDATGVDGNTPLLAAAINGRESVVLALVNAGAKPDQKLLGANMPERIRKLLQASVGPAPTETPPEMADLATLWVDCAQDADWQLRIDRCTTIISRAKDLETSAQKALLNRGIGYDQSGDYDRAIADFDAAIAIDPNYVRAYLNRGHSLRALHISSKNWAPILGDYDTAIRLDPLYFPAYLARGKLLSLMKEEEQAIENYNTAIGIKPDYAPAYVLRGISFQLLRKQQRAIEEYGQAIRLDPAYIDAYIWRGNAYISLNQYQRAIDDFSNVIAIDPDNMSAYTGRALAYALLKKPKLSKADSAKYEALFSAWKSRQTGSYDNVHLNLLGSLGPLARGLQ